MTCSVDSLKFTASWKGQIREAKLQVQVINPLKLYLLNFLCAYGSINKLNTVKCLFFCFIKCIAHPIPTSKRTSKY